MARETSLVLRTWLIEKNGLSKTPASNRLVGFCIENERWKPASLKYGRLLKFGGVRSPPSRRADRLDPFWMKLPSDSVYAKFPAIWSSSVSRCEAFSRPDRFS